MSRILFWKPVVVTIIGVLCFLNTIQAQTAPLFGKKEILEHTKSASQTSSKKRPSLKPSWNPLTLVLRSLLFVYQSKISRQYQATCLYHPSCSNFSKECFQLYSVPKVLMLTIDRMTRCNRLAINRHTQYDIFTGEATIKINDPPSRYHFH